jgi:cytochrome c peroxidase
MASRSWVSGAALCAVLTSISCNDGTKRTGGNDDAGPRSDGAGPTARPRRQFADAAPADGSDRADPAPVISPEARSVLETLRYDARPFSADPSNRFADDPAARELGHRLFFDPSLSGRLIESDNDGSIATLGRAGDAGKVSCAGCHVPSSGFVDTRSPHQQISLAAQWGRRRAPTLLEVAGAPLFNWDGRRDTLWAQAIGVMENDTEFNSGRLFVAQQVFRRYRTRYEAIFGAMPELDDASLFPQLTAETVGCQTGAATAPCRGKPGDHAEYDGMSAQSRNAVTAVTVNAAKALAAYLRQLRCGPSKFEAWLDGDAGALGPSEQRGAALFVGSARCVNCHTGANFTDGEFHNVGLRPATVAVAFTDTDDRGAGAALPLALSDPLNARGAFSDGDRGALPGSVGAALEGAFRTPTLRCISRQPSFMHTGQYRTLGTVVAFFSKGGDPIGFPGTNELTRLDLGDREQDDLVSFILALQGQGPEPALLTTEE